MPYRYECVCSVISQENIFIVDTNEVKAVPVSSHFLAYTTVVNLAPKLYSSTLRTGLFCLFVRF